MKNLFRCILFMSLFLFVCSCRKDDVEKEMKYSKAVLFYMVSENSLDSFLSLDVNEILAAKSKLADDEEIILYVDNCEIPAIYKITNKTQGEKFSQLVPEYKYAEDFNSCSGESLKGFYDYVKAHYPADNYGMVFWSHGQGWLPSSFEGDSQNFSKRRRSFGIDNGKNSSKLDKGNQMCISELRDALSSFGRQFDYIFFDCCFMQCIEVAYELRDVTKYIIGSPAEIPGPGADYITLLPELFAKSNYQITIPDTYYKAYKDGVKVDMQNSYGVLISSIDCSQLQNFAVATEKVVAKHRDELLNMDYSKVQNYFNYENCRHIAKFPDFYDMNGIMMKLLPEDEYQNWKKSFDSAVIYANTSGFWITIYPFVMTQYVDRSQFGGVSMYVPLEKYSKGYYASANEFFVQGYFASNWAKILWKGWLI